MAAERRTHDARDLPGEVSTRDLIPPVAFASEHPLPAFENVARQVGVDVYGLAGGAVLDDFDKDGLLDLVVSHSGFEDQTRLFLNRGNGTFEDRTENAGLAGEVGGLNMVQADYDNDGFVDVLVLRGGWMGPAVRFPLSLLRNKGNGTFTDVTKAAGLLTHRAPTQTATWLDYDGDGWLDLFVGNETRAGGIEEPSPCELFHNNRDGTFANVGRETGVDLVGFVKGVVSGDHNNDGRPDIFVSVKGARTCCSGTTALQATSADGASRTSRRRRASPSRRTVSVPSSSTSTTTAGRTSTSRAGVDSTPRPWRPTSRPTI